MAATFGMKEKDKLPDWAVSTANRIEEHGFKWVFDPLYPVPAPGDLERIQVRDEIHVGQAAEVARYKQAMKRGDKFPPGVVTQDGWIVDYNTRARAAHDLGLPTFPVFVVQEDYENADGFIEQRLWVLGGAFNAGPKPLTRSELTKILRKVAANPEDWDSNKLSERLQVSRNVVVSIFAQFRAEQRAEDLGISLNGSVPASTRQMLGQRSDKLADDVFRETVRLIQDAGLIGAEASDLVKKVIGISTGDVDRLAFIEDEWAAREQQIEKFKAGGKRKPPLSTRVRTCLEFLTEHEQEVNLLVDLNPNTREDYLSLLERTQAVMSALSEAQRRANDLAEVN